MIDSRELALRTSIDDLYTVFSRYPLPKDTRTCRCGCVSKENVQLLTSKPLRALEASDLSRYARRALSTWGDSGVFRHFLPRIFEFLADQSSVPALPVDAEIVLRKLKMAEWLTWPSEQHDAIRNYLKALWAVRRVRTLEGYENYEEPNEEWLCAIAQSEPTLAPLF